MYIAPPVALLQLLPIPRTHKGGGLGVVVTYILLVKSEIIRRQGYLVEEHEITTSDQYILCLIRLYTKQSRKVVLLQHGLLDSSHAWVMNLKNQSLGYILADYGYDVWLGNSRGNTYSKKHKHLDSSQKEYWDFSWQEMSGYDFPATIRYIISVTKVKQLSYIGFSQVKNTQICLYKRKLQIISKKLNEQFQWLILRLCVLVKHLTSIIHVSC
ncbi:unnamed protein product [Schistosoma mattheei]|uniref:Partial AB-hydrolase lipase domain-containing protein n=1 Tax=Schistosoma mattheei TaxID=31246 RepID=A0A3P8CGQ7_9TREM|nr:unnamed protein product [Schistosoma mattheei]